MAQVKVPGASTLCIDDTSTNYCILDFADLRDCWDGTCSNPPTHLPRPEAVRSFEFSVGGGHYETQLNHDSDTNGIDLLYLDTIFNLSDFRPDEDDRVKSILDVFPLVADVLRRMVNLERLVWAADSPMINGIDDTIVGLPKCECKTVSRLCLRRLSHPSTHAVRHLEVDLVS